MEALSTSETLLPFYQTTRYHIPEVISNPVIRHRKNKKRKQFATSKQQKEQWTWYLCDRASLVEAVRNVMAHGDAWEGKWWGNRRLERVATTLALYLGTSMVCPLIRTPRLPIVDRTDSPADLNGLVHFSERPNLVSARAPSRFKRALQRCKQPTRCNNFFVY